MINVKKEKYAKVVPANIFVDIEKEKIRNKEGSITEVKYSPESLKLLKQRIAKEYKLNPSSIITYDEMIKLPESKNKKWNVLVWKGHGDDAAIRKDVLGIYLLIH